MKNTPALMASVDDLLDARGAALAEFDNVSILGR